jgi:starch phosphorylase
VADEGAQDWADAQDLYRLLETEIVPAYYERDEEGIPRRWLDLMKESMASTVWQFSTSRMLQQYVEELYVPAAAADAGAARGQAEPVGAGRGRSKS